MFILGGDLVVATGERRATRCWRNTLIPLFAKMISAELSAGAECSVSQWYSMSTVDGTRQLPPHCQMQGKTIGTNVRYMGKRVCELWANYAIVAFCLDLARSRGLFFLFCFAFQPSTSYMYPTKVHLLFSLLRNCNRANRAKGNSTLFLLSFFSSI